MRSDRTMSVLTIQACSGAAACTAEGLCLPINLVKVRMQLSIKPLTIRDAAVAATAELGYLGLWRGLGPALARQLVYGQLRIGLYQNVAPQVHSTSEKLAVGACSGAVAAALANPLDLVMVRMQAANSLTQHSMLNALRRVAHEHTLLGLWTGVTPTVVRAAVVTATEQTSYDVMKTRLRSEFGFRDALPLHTLSSFIAGLLVVAITSPMDVVKTTAFTQAKVAGPLQITLTLWRERGLLGFYRGIVPYWFRMGPWSTIMFLSLEEYKRVARWMSR